MDHDSKPLCTQMAAKVCYKLQVVVHDLQGASEGAQDSLTLGLTLGMLLASRVSIFGSDDQHGGALVDVVMVAQPGTWSIN